MRSIVDIAIAASPTGRAIARVALAAGGLLVVAACEPANAPASEAVETEAVEPVATPVPVPAPVELSVADMQRVCVAGLAAVYGQEPAAIETLAPTAGVVSASWRAPVDGGRQSAECRVDGDRILWRPLDMPEPEDERWMDQPGDPRVVYEIAGETIAVTQTLADGTTDRVVLSVPAIREAR